MSGSFLNSSGLAALISTVGGVTATYITYVVARRRRVRAPRDRMDTIFDGYEKLIEQQQVEIERKGGVISSLENVVSRLEEELGKTRQLLNDTRTDLSTARDQNELLKVQLQEMRHDYAGT
jgi:predicted  nucleic acid-binding Zn-ribbon protein